MLLRKKQEIENWLNQYHIRNYELIQNAKYGYVVNVNNNVDLYNRNLKSIDIKFNHVTGWFDCSENELTSLEGCPNIVNGDFYCSYNQLTSLKYCPRVIFGSLYCRKNKLISLNDCCHTIVDGNFNCTINDLTIKGLEKLPLINKKIELFGNKQLGYLENITDFNELKNKLNEVFNLEKEKENLLKLINNENLINNKNINKI